MRARGAAHTAAPGPTTAVGEPCSQQPSQTTSLTPTSHSSPSLLPPSLPTHSRAWAAALWAAPTSSRSLPPSVSATSKASPSKPRCVREHRHCSFVSVFSPSSTAHCFMLHARPSSSSSLPQYVGMSEVPEPRGMQMMVTAIGRVRVRLCWRGCFVPPPFLTHLPVSRRPTTNPPRSPNPRCTLSSPRPA